MMNQRLLHTTTIWTLIGIFFGNLVQPVTVCGEQTLQPVDSNFQVESEEELTEDRIAALIEGLGSDSYAVRIHCRDRLSQIGLAAFDQLRDAQEHADNEIAMVAQQLTASLEIRWSAPGDSKRVQELLWEYSSLSPRERQRNIEELGQLQPEESFAALVRLARHEPEGSLGRFAAITAIKEGAITGPSDAEQMSDEARRSRAAIIASVVGKDEQTASRWLRQYADDLTSGSIAVDAWSDLIDQSRIQIKDPSANEETINGVTSEILQLTWAVARRGQIARAHRIALGKNTDRKNADRNASDGNDTDDGQANDGNAIELASVMRLVTDQVDLIPPRTHELLRYATMAIDQEFYPTVLVMQEQFSTLFSRSPVLLYAAAEARLRSGDEDAATELAARAIEINPLELAQAGKEGDAEPKIAPEDADRQRVLENRAEAHLDIAETLSERGLFRWAEREYQLIIDALPIESTVSANARLKLVAIFTELTRHADIVKTLQPLADRTEKDDEIKGALIVAQLYPLIASQIEYHRGLMAMQNKDWETARKSLRDAFERDQSNVDILIQMYRTDGDERWREHVMDELQKHIRAAEHAVIASQEGPRIGPFATNDRELASQLNNYAWLVCNTEGDFAKALQFSELSLRKNPGQAALMDTCARCYFVNGDVKSAVEMQRRACRAEPYSPLLRRQLEEFESAELKQKEKSDE